VYQSATLITLGTYATLLLQGAFPWLVFHRKLKWLVLGAAASFHSGIALLMGLVWFSSIIISVDLLFIDDETFDAAFARLRSWVLRHAPSGQIVVIYDGTCGFCRRVVSVLKRLDAPARVELVAAAPQDAMYAITGGETYRGYWAFQVLLATLPSTWMLAAIMRIRLVSIAGEAVYGLIAKNRTRLGCEGNVCTAAR
jgi:predicted DCC family thiol-disulfide oxidoreductase YuxK